MPSATPAAAAAAGRRKKENPTTIRPRWQLPDGRITSRSKPFPLTHLLSDLHLRNQIQRAPEQTAPPTRRATSTDTDAPALRAP